MGTNYEIQVWQRQLGRRNGAYGEYGWDTIWTGNSRFRLICAFAVALPARQRRPLQLVWR